MTKGRVLRNATYEAQSLEGKKLRIVRIWDGRRGWSVSEEAEWRGLRGGQSGNVVDVDFGGVLAFKVAGGCNLVEGCFLEGPIVQLIRVFVRVGMLERDLILRNCPFLLPNLKQSRQWPSDTVAGGRRLCRCLLVQTTRVASSALDS